MDFLGFLGPSELLVCAIVTLIVFGPNRLPELARHLAKLTKIFREASRELQRQIDMSDLQLDLDKPPKPKKISSSQNTDQDYSYPYGEEEEGSHYTDMGKDENAGYDGYPDNQTAVEEKSEENLETASETEQTPAAAQSANRIVVDEEIKTQDAARLQRESID